MTSDLSEATVYIFLPGQGYVPTGILEKQGTAYTFQYGRRYLQRPDALPIDPVSMPLEFTGSMVSRQGLRMFNALRDAAPDKWGRKVLSLLAGKDMGMLSELDVLTAFHSQFRIGALAFGPSPTSAPMSMASWAPKRDPFVRSFKDLEKVMRVVQEIEGLDDDDLDDYRDRQDDPFFQACTSIFSVGGARPKCLLGLDGSFWIAKFPKADDSWNEPLIEHATMKLARQCGVYVAETRLAEVLGRDILLVKRFDRKDDFAALHLISGLTLCDRAEDGDWGSYQDLAEQSRRHAAPEAGEQLFRRMVVNMALANTDDHLRNQAWFVTKNGVELTPGFDIVPQWRPNVGHQALRCGSEGHQPTIQNALSDVYPFGLLPAEAEKIIEEIQGVMSTWAHSFRMDGVSEPDIERLSHRIKPLL